MSENKTKNVEVSAAALDKKYNLWNRVFTYTFFGMLIAVAVFVIIAYFNGHFDSFDALKNYLATFGWWGPVILCLIQTVRAALPFIPGTIGCFVGAALFGPLPGFIANYLGISFGSLLAFFLARKFGQPVIDKLFKGPKYKKFMDWASNSKSYPKVLLMAIALPLFPDDLFCYFSGITKISFKKFLVIVFIGKPWTILVYSFFFAEILDFLGKYISFI